MFRQTIIAILVGIAATLATQAQQTKLQVERSFKSYKRHSTIHPETKMMELKQVVPGIVYDLKYADSDNFMQRRMYSKGTNTTFLRKPAAAALAAVQEDLKKSGLGIKVFDAYRPFSVTEKFWELVKDERYVANPVKGSNHNRGTAVDLTLIDLKTDKELNMGTGFDNFTDTAHHTFKALPKHILDNRALLKSAMEKHGFTALATEWWHYTFKSNISFTVLDIPFRKLFR
ncbi:M15 family metallopeptidase [Niabella ginsengisoli]|uniref:D-alanyl-D-alanine dipeptidase n=1 Tax=Niabella ginsengisoli TaxID=522298 RepID=A0ABS9SGB4_9BACT|nr:M15 family metallopeptidase [Niabella ginsengisoli]MCH5597395.1 M15 family metallopeptidase [Niabella ginsengisoli]